MGLQDWKERIDYCGCVKVGSVVLLGRLALVGERQRGWVFG